MIKRNFFFKFINTNLKIFYIILTLRLIDIIIVKKVYGFRRLLKKIKNKKTLRKHYHKDLNNQEILKKVYNFCNFLGVDSCFIKSSLACTSFINNDDKIFFYIGVKNDNKLFSSHSWININNSSIMENKENINSFEIILSVSI